MQAQLINARILELLPVDNSSQPHLVGNPWLHAEHLCAWLHGGGIRSMRMHKRPRTKLLLKTVKGCMHPMAEKGTDYRHVSLGKVT